MALIQSKQINPNWGGLQINNLGAPTLPGDATNKQYVDNLVNGLKWKQPVRAVATANLAITGVPAPVDGVAIIAGDRILLDGQAAPVQNGIWVVSAGAWTRPLDFPVGGSASNAAVFVQEGATYGDTAWVCTTDPPADIIDTSPLNFAQFASPGVYVAGNGINITGLTISAVAAPDGSIVVGPTGIGVGVLASDAQHGVRGGGTQHAVALPAVPGFIGGLPASSVANNPALYNDATGKVLKAAAYTIPAVDGTVGQVLTTNGLGVVTFQALPAGNAPSAQNQDQAPAVTVGNDQPTGITIATTSAGAVSVFVNGARQDLGNNVTTQDCYFGTGPGVPVSSVNVPATTQLFWNSTIAGFALAASDSVSLVYNA